MTMAAERLVVVGLFAGLLLGTLGCSDVCGSQVARDPTELRGLDRCRVVDGELLVEAGYRDELVLPKLEEVTGRVVIRDVAVVDLPALERVGSGVTRGDLTVAGLSGRLSAPVLETIGRGWYEEPDDAFLEEHGLALAADSATQVELGSLRIAGRLTVEGFRTAIDLPSLQNLGSTTFIGAAPEVLELPVLPTSLRVTATEGATTLRIPQSGTTGRIEVLNNVDLVTVELSPVAVSRLDVVENPALETVRAPDLSEGTASVTDNPSLATFETGLPCADLDWRRNALEVPDGAPGCR